MDELHEYQEAFGRPVEVNALGRHAQTSVGASEGLETTAAMPKYGHDYAGKAGESSQSDKFGKAAERAQEGEAGKSGKKHAADNPDNPDNPDKAHKSDKPKKLKKSSKLGKGEPGGKAQQATAKLTKVKVPGLFTPMSLRQVQVRNRIWLPPMCMYSVQAQDGVATDFHYQHYVSRALGGFGLVIVESTAVSPQARISPCDLGLWNDRQEQALQRIATDVRAAGAVPVIQLNHAGRKASSGCSSLGYISRTVPADLGGWQPLAPSPLAYGKMDTPRQLGVGEIGAIVEDFAAAARRAVRAGFEGIEIHAAHGYLLSEFLDPLTNVRSDEYGGEFEHRIRLVVEVADAIRAAIPQTMPLLVRVSATDWAQGGWDLEQTIELARVLKAHGVDLVDVSTGAIVSGVYTPAKPGYQVPFAQQVRAQALVPTTAVGLITKPKQAECIVRWGQADAVEIGRAALRDPYWPLRAAYKLGLPTNQAPYPQAYLQGAYGTKR
ncbi:NADH-dependent flavin oxidoreductase [Bombiscardovia nodaiensis]|uniref:NADH-dependent flavin oxidoreductase n=1 Tax=Bombiscardovia nodaiensis TaxID=2932181 RepID=A0ABN6SE50_9BIFI|nr:NADH-dependent flavin oxidoreductase [Bombiscardovia nodaiensis]